MSLIANSIAEYQQTMAECTISIGKSLGMMNIELRERATALVEEKQRSALQGFMRTIDEDFSKMMETVGRITESTMNNAGQYISPSFGHNSMSRGVDDTKLLR